MRDKTGGPAFPIDLILTDERRVYKGMTLRDYFAAKAMQAMAHYKFDGVAARAYEMADAMLKAREGT